MNQAVRSRWTTSAVRQAIALRDRQGRARRAGRCPRAPRSRRSSCRESSTAGTRTSRRTSTTRTRPRRSSPRPATRANPLTLEFNYPTDVSRPYMPDPEQIFTVHLDAARGGRHHGRTPTCGRRGARTTSTRSRARRTTASTCSAGPVTTTTPTTSSASSSASQSAEWGFDNPELFAALTRGPRDPEPRRADRAVRGHQPDGRWSSCRASRSRTRCRRSRSRSASRATRPARSGRGLHRHRPDRVDRGTCRNVRCGGARRSPRPAPRTVPDTPGRTPLCCAPSATAAPADPDAVRLSASCCSCGCARCPGGPAVALLGERATPGGRRADQRALRLRRADHRAVLHLDGPLLSGRLRQLHRDRPAGAGGVHRAASRPRSSCRSPR